MLIHRSEDINYHFSGNVSLFIYLIKAESFTELELLTGLGLPARELQGSIFVFFVLNKPAFQKIILPLFMCVCVCLSGCMYTLCIAGAHGSQKWHWVSWN